MKGMWLKALPVLLAAAWMPIAVRLYRRWRIRKDPVDFATAILTVFVVYGNFLFFVTYLGLDASETWAFWWGVQTFVCVIFYLAFRPGLRDRDDGETVGADPVVTTILVVEDDAGSREALRSVLQSEGFSVVAAGDGEEALRTLHRDDKIGLILLDLFLPHVSGAEFRKRQLLEPALKDIPVVIVSGYAKAANAIVSGDGVLAFLTKPIDLDELIRVVEKAGVSRIRKSISAERLS